MAVAHAQFLKCEGIRSSYNILSGLPVSFTSPIYTPGRRDTHYAETIFLICFRKRKTPMSKQKLCNTLLTGIK